MLNIVRFGAAVLKKNIFLAFKFPYISPCKSLKPLKWGHT